MESRTEKRRMEKIGSAAAGIAHDINNQLTLILNYLDFADVDAARTAAGRCRTLTASLLSYSRGEDPTLQPLRLPQFVYEHLQSQPLPRGVRWTLDVDEPIVEARADAVSLGRVLSNLLSNACQAMENKGLLRIRVNGTTIEIEDSGPGIEEADLRRIFEPFYTTKGARGTGLGLAIVRDIMRRHGGSVAVRSERGRGATFVLRFRPASRPD
jgi:signal transduction histidine kinase